MERVGRVSCFRSDSLLSSSSLKTCRRSCEPRSLAKIGCKGEEDSNDVRRSEFICCGVSSEG